jgi:3-oxoadipate enol-lactonase
MKLRANGLTFEVRIEGSSGGSWVMLSHPIATNMSIWESQIGALGSRFKLLRYDTRGHGASDVPSGDYCINDLVDDAIGLMDALSIEKAHFVGLSLGGVTAIGLAMTYPGRLSSVSICSARADAPAAFRAAWEERIHLAVERGMSALTEPTVRRWFAAVGSFEKPAAWDAIREMIGSTPVEGFVGCARVLQALDFEASLDKIAVPALLLVGDEDDVLPGINRTMTARIPGARMVSITGAGHLPNVEQPAAFSSALLEFLDSVEASG